MKVRFSCPMDCFDVCSLVATVRDGRVVKISGDPEHPLTKGHVCVKGKKLLERMYHPDRLVRPGKKIGGKWTAVPWDEAISEIAERLETVRRKYGSLAVLNYSGSAYNGISKTVDKIFFNHYGGVTVPRGSLCWGAGIAAQRYDFGDVRGHAPDDMAMAKTMILWGRNPADTHPHLIRYIREAKKNGATVFLIDPIRTATANIADTHVAIRPATDAALALGMANHIVENGMADNEYIENNVVGFERFRKYARNFPLETVEEITGVDRQTVARLAEIYANARPSCIVLGQGMQRYHNGGNTIRCIDALGAITGNIGISGGGVNYANFGVSRYLAGELEKSMMFVKNRRSFPIPKFGEFLETATDPPVEFMVVSKANPLVQVPDTAKTARAFQKTGFRVVIDMFMTDTAEHADLVLPCTGVLEEEDIFVGNMFTPYVNYSKKSVEPPGGIMGEYRFFGLLAEKMGMGEYPNFSQNEFLERSVAPLKKYGVDANTLEEMGHFSLPGREIPWHDATFDTPSGKYELYSQKAEKDGQSPIPIFIEPKDPEPDYPVRLITPHYRHSIHSQHFAFTDEMPVIHMNKKMMARLNVSDQGVADVISKTGRLRVKVRCSEGIGDGIAMIYQGRWHKSGAVNCLTAGNLSDMGEQAAYYDCFCRIMPTCKK